MSNSSSPAGSVEFTTKDDIDSKSLGSKQDEVTEPSKGRPELIYKKTQNLLQQAKEERRLRAKKLDNLVQAHIENGYNDILDAIPPLTHAFLSKEGRKPPTSGRKSVVGGSRRKSVTPKKRDSILPTFTNVTSSKLPDGTYNVAQERRASTGLNIIPFDPSGWNEVVAPSLLQPPTSPGEPLTPESKRLLDTVEEEKKEDILSSWVDSGGFMTMSSEKFSVHEIVIDMLKMGKPKSLDEEEYRFSICNMHDLLQEHYQLLQDTNKQTAAFLSKQDGGEDFYGTLKTAVGETRLREHLVWEHSEGEKMKLKLPLRHQYVTAAAFHKSVMKKNLTESVTKKQLSRRTDFDFEKDEEVRSQVFSQPPKTPEAKSISPPQSPRGIQKTSRLFDRRKSGAPNQANLPQLQVPTGDTEGPDTQKLSDNGLMKKLHSPKGSPRIEEKSQRVREILKKAGLLGRLTQPGYDTEQARVSKLLSTVRLLLRQKSLQDSIVHSGTHMSPSPAGNAGLQEASPSSYRKLPTIHYRSSSLKGVEASGSVPYATSLVQPTSKRHNEQHIQDLADICFGSAARAAFPVTLHAEDGTLLNALESLRGMDLPAVTSVHYPRYVGDYTELRTMNEILPCPSLDEDQALKEIAREIDWDIMLSQTDSNPLSAQSFTSRPTTHTGKLVSSSFLREPKRLPPERDTFIGKDLALLPHPERRFEVSLPPEGSTLPPLGLRNASAALSAYLNYAKMRPDLARIASNKETRSVRYILALQHSALLQIKAKRWTEMREDREVALS